MEGTGQSGDAHGGDGPGQPPQRPVEGPLPRELPGHRACQAALRVRPVAEETQGLDVDQWNEARDEGIEGTPTLVISGPEGTTELVGAVPIERVVSAIDEVKSS